MDGGRMKWFDAGVPGWLNLRAVALTVATLLCLVCLDGTVPRSAPTEDRAADGAAEPSGSRHRLTVRVVDQAGKPLPGAEVAISRQKRSTYPLVFQGPIPERGKTLDLPKGRYWILARAPGHARGAELTTLRETQTIEMKLAPALPRTVEVVRDEGGTLMPLAGATVLFESPELALPLGGETDDRGRATFPHAPSGELSVLVYAPGFEPYEAVVSGDLLVRLRPVKLLRVRVRSQGKPVAGATVSIAGLSLWPARAVQTGPKGSVDITGLRAGRYTLSAHHENLVTPDVAVELLGEAGVQTVDLELEPGVFVEAMVLDAEGNPIAEARVTHGQAGVSARQLHALTDAAGMFSIGPLQRRGGQLQVGKAGYVTRLEPVTADEPTEIELLRAGRVEGRVVDAGGRPVPGATVEVVGTDHFGMPISVSTRSTAIPGAHFDWALESQGVLLPAGELGVLLGPVPAIPLAAAAPLGGEMLTTDESVRFGVSEVPPGKVLVLGRHPDHMDGRSQVVTLEPGGVAQVEVRLGSGRPLRGRVLDHRGFPATDARVTAAGIGFDRQFGVEPDGTFFLAAAPEQVRLRIGRAQNPLSVLLDHTVAKEERDQEVRIELPPPREASRVLCVTERGDPVPLAQVSVLSIERSAPLRLTRFTSQTGQLELDGVRGLRVRVEVSAPSFVSRSFELKLSEELRVVLQKAIDAAGRVTAVRGRHPAVGAEVSYSAGEVERRAITGELGEYRLSDIPPGPGRLTVRHPEHGQAQKAVVLTAPSRDGDAQLPDVDLEPAIEVSGRVVDDAGQPLAGAILAFDRIGPYVPLQEDASEVGRADADGRFVVEVPPGSPLYLFAMTPGGSFGFSAAATPNSRGRVEDLEVLLDRVDEVTPDVRGTVLVALERAPGSTGLVIYAVPRGSSGQRAGLRAQDRLLAIDGQTVTTVELARQQLSGAPGTDVLLDVVASGARKSVRVLREPFRR